MQRGLCEQVRGKDYEESCDQSEAVVWRCSVKKVLLKFWQNSQENTCGAVSFFNKVAGLNTFFCRTPPVAASEHLTMVPSGSKAQGAFVGQLFYKTLHRHHHR